MRRTMLTAGPAVLTPVGGASTANTSTAFEDIVWGGAAALEPGTVTSVSARFVVASATIRFFTIRDVAGTWTVRDATGNLTSVAGLSSYTVALAIQPGDFLGVHQNNGAAEIRYVASGSGTYYRSTSAVDPVAGGTYTVASTDTNHTFAFVGTGTQ